MTKEPFGGAGGLYVDYEELKRKERREAMRAREKAVALYRFEAVKARNEMGKPLTRKERRLLAQAGRKRK